MIIKQIAVAVIGITLLAGMIFLPKIIGTSNIGHSKLALGDTLILPVSSNIISKNTKEQTPQNYYMNSNLSMNALNSVHNYGQLVNNDELDSNLKESEIVDIFLLKDNLYKLIIENNKRYIDISNPISNVTINKIDISQINEPKALCVFENLIYVYDNLTKNIFCLNVDGQILKSQKISNEKLDVKHMWIDHKNIHLTIYNNGQIEYITKTLLS